MTTHQPAGTARARDTTHNADNDVRLLSRETCATIVQRLLKQVRGDGETLIRVSCWWNGEARWARNNITAMSDRQDVELHLARRIGGAYGQAFTNQLDDASLAATVREAERSAHDFANVTYKELYAEEPELAMPSPTIWSDATMAATTEARSQLAFALASGGEAKGMLSAGYLELRGGSRANFIIADPGVAELNARPAAAALSTIRDAMTYAVYTQAQCSMTVRHPKGQGSGWAGLSGFDWAQIDAKTLAERALDKCLKSLDPVRIEPGRYTVILEPQAVAELLDVLTTDMSGGNPLIRFHAEGEGSGPFTLGMDPITGLTRTRLGQQVVDSRITISHDPMDAQLGTIPQRGLAPITWINNGILQTLAYNRDYAVSMLNDNLPALLRPAYRMSGGTTTIDEMIASTKRGLLVTRLSNLRVLDRASLLSTGVTRDGLWLIEHGKISKAVKNMRLTESPLFVLNQVDQMGVPVPVFRPVRNPFDAQITPALVPPIKANDFSFTSTIDAV